MHMLNPKVSEISLFPMLSVNFISSSRNVPHLRASFRTSSPINKMRCLTVSPSSSSAQVSLSHSPNEQSFVVSYLINSCGLAPELARSKARYLNFNTPEKPDTVLAFLKKYGFTKSQISNIIGKLPVFLCYNPEKILLPKLTFLRSLGLSREETIIITNEAPYILQRSLRKVLIPSFNSLRNLFQSDDKTLDTIRRYPHILASNHGEEIIEILREEGVPPAKIVYLLNNYKLPRLTQEDYKKIVEAVKEWGFNYSTSKFITVIEIMIGSRKSTLDKKVQLFKKFGWSDREFLRAFEKKPKIILISYDKIMRVMDFLVNQMGVDAKSMATYPGILTMSLEKSIVPRCFIYQALLEKVLSKKRRKPGITTLLRLTSKKFHIKYIKPYEDEAPELVSLYHKMLDG